ncbi:DUF6527 family protein [Lentzea sp. NPDC058450]|uniref:DUF6527 family protein n=1 Tax=Lentzea sp. NPDC058450 TaxID=3346505 RepID=UPI00365DDEA7
MSEETHLRPEFVASFPTPMERGVMYVSIEYNNCGHLCACGCGLEVITPLSPAQWAITYDGESISIWPSVGNWSLPCRSHYIVDRSRVRWARSFTEREIERNRTRDRALLEEQDSENEQLIDKRTDSAGITSDFLGADRSRVGTWKWLISRVRRLMS